MSKKVAFRMRVTRIYENGHGVCRVEKSISDVSNDVPCTAIKIDSTKQYYFLVLLN